MAGGGEEAQGGAGGKVVGCARSESCWGRARASGRLGGRSWARRGSARAGLDNAGGPRSARWLSDSVGESHRVLHRHVNVQRIMLRTIISVYTAVLRKSCSGPRLHRLTLYWLQRLSPATVSALSPAIVSSDSNSKSRLVHRLALQRPSVSSNSDRQNG